MYKLLLPLLAAASSVQAIVGHGGAGILKKQQLLVSTPTSSASDAIKSATFTQLLDHNNPSAGTFEQTYWYTDQWYKGPGSPILLFAPNEANGSLFTPLIGADYLNGALAAEVGGASMLIEHRYWGSSSPVDDLTTANLQYLNLDQAIQDVVYFAQNVKLPFATKGGYSPKDAPWVLIGGSYSGALTAWIENKAPGTFWAYLATSAVVETISNFWQYYKQVELGMPKNCSKDVNLVINHMDSVFASGKAKQIANLKKMFNLQDLEHADDVMSALSIGPQLWQNPGSFSEGQDPFYTWCDYVENAENGGTVPGANGVGLQKALAGYAKWWTEVQLPGYCQNYGYADFQGENNTACFNTYNASSPLFTDTSLSNVADRQWIWMLCDNPFGWWADGAPKGQSTIVSRLLDVKYNTRQCGLYFPTGPQGQTYGIKQGKTETQVNSYTGGWNIGGVDKSTRLVITNGQYDPWRDATVSSFYRPGGPLESASGVAVNMVPFGNHCSDLSLANGKANAGVAAVQKTEIAVMSKWISQFKKPTHYSH